MTDPEVKLFTVHEAEQTLAQAEPLVRRLQALGRALSTTPPPDDDAARDAQVAQFEDALTRLHALGCHLKDLELGLLDFYSLRDGQIVFLCWRLGEAGIGFWHEVEAGFAGRRPLTNHERHTRFLRLSL